MKTARVHSTSNALVIYLSLLFVSGWLSAPAIFAAEESCSSCSKKVTFSGDFAHSRAFGRATLEGAPAGLEEYYRESIYGPNFTATISGLPDGKYTITVGVVEAGVDFTNAGQRVFDISAGDQVLAKGLDIVARAGGPNKVIFVSGTVEHRDDTLAGPLELNFHATTATAKMNTLEIKNADTGTSVIYVRAGDLVESADMAAQTIPQ